MYRLQFGECFGIVDFVFERFICICLTTFITLEGSRWTKLHKTCWRNQYAYTHTRTHTAHTLTGPTVSTYCCNNHATATAHRLNAIAYMHAVRTTHTKRFLPMHQLLRAHTTPTESKRTHDTQHISHANHGKSSSIGTSRRANRTKHTTPNVTPTTHSLSLCGWSGDVHLCPTSTTTATTTTVQEPRCNNNTNNNNNDLGLVVVCRPG